MVRRRTVLKIAAAATALSGSTSTASRAVAESARGSGAFPATATGGIDAEHPEAPRPAGGAHFARGRRMAFLRFDPVPDRPVQRAKLRFTVTAQHNSDGGYWPFEVYAVDARGWNPDTVTWDDSPRHGGDWLALVDASSAADADPRGIHEIDVWSKNWRRHSGDHQIRLVMTS